ARVARDVRHVAVVTDGHDAVAVEGDLNEVAGTRVVGRADDGEDLAAIEPCRHQVPVVNGGVVAEVLADLAPAGARKARHEVEGHVLGQHGTDAVPVARVEQLCVADDRGRRGRGPGGRLAPRLEPSATAVERALTAGTLSSRSAAISSTEWPSTSLRITQLRGVGGSSRNAVRAARTASPAMSPSSAPAPSAAMSSMSLSGCPIRRSYRRRWSSARRWAIWNSHGRRRDTSAPDSAS